MPTFTIMGSGIGFVGGNYKNDHPSQAAKKAGKALFKQLENGKYSKYKNKKNIKFILRMRDRHGPGKTYSYSASREKLKKPIEVKDKNKNVLYTVYYNYSVVPCDMEQKEIMKMTGGTLKKVGGNPDLNPEEVGDDTEASFPGEGDVSTEEPVEDEQDVDDDKDEQPVVEEEVEAPSDETPSDEDPTEEITGGKRKSKSKSTKKKTTTDKPKPKTKSKSKK